MPKIRPAVTISEIKLVNDGSSRSLAKINPATVNPRNILFTPLGLVSLFFT
jgi:hypothetical protein